VPDPAEVFFEYPGMCTVSSSSFEDAGIFSRGYSHELRRSVFQIPEVMLWFLHLTCIFEIV